MRYLFGFLCVCALGLMPVVGCGESTCARGCLDGLRVNLDPSVTSTYDVDLVLDGASGAFTCEWSDVSGWMGPTNQKGSAQTAVNCGSGGFWIQATPEAVEISLTAQDGSWTGSVKANPDYVRVTRCPGGSELCPPFALTVVEQQ